jgi:hypothetical protein
MTCPLSLLNWASSSTALLFQVWPEAHNPPPLFANANCPYLVGALLSQRSQSQQLMLDSFFASLPGHLGLERVASDRAFAQARNKLNPSALTAFNAQLLDLQERTDRVCNHSYVASLMQHMLPRLLLLLGALATSIAQSIELLKGNLVRRVEGRSRLRPASKNKPHPHLSYKRKWLKFGGLGKVGLHAEGSGQV